MSKPDSNPLKRISKPVEPRLDSDTFKLEEAYEAARDARDIIRDKQRREARELSSYTDEEVSTARHNLPDQHIHVHVNQSSPELEVETSIELGPLKAKGLPRWATAAIVGVGIVAAVATAIASHLSAAK
jgi:hypothetical protein